ncbi:uncharacterized protein At5g48480 [Silene latifolia]|uniref:uncharacterized protein At5g48480 n=1 Tax=Silene latifolia TaxID=37657 RepID=UPI003D76DE22
MAAAEAQEVQNGAAADNGTTTVTTVTPTAETTAVTFSSFKTQLVVEAPKAADAVAFYKAAFGVEEVNRLMHPKRKAEQEQPLVLSADLKLASAIFSVSDSIDETPLVKNDGNGAANVVFALEAEDVQAAVNKAVGAGAVAEGEISEVEGGGRVAKLKDPYGYLWVISSVAKVVSEAAADAQA